MAGIHDHALQEQLQRERLDEAAMERQAAATPDGYVVAPAPEPPLRRQALMAIRDAVTGLVWCSLLFREVGGLGRIFAIVVALGFVAMATSDARRIVRRARAAEAA